MFTASDGTLIDITEHIAPENRAVIVLWPCMTGNTAMYRLPVGSFSEAGISSVQFNPRGHGNSGGQFDLELCTRDLNEYLSSLGMDRTPLWLTGHSAGGSAILRYCTYYGQAERCVLVSPVLDSIGSCRYLYENGNQSESGMLISSLTDDREFMLSVLADSNWMNREVWENRSLRKKIDEISKGPLIGTLMEKLFIDGYNTYNDLEQHRSLTSILLPVKDNWFPISLTVGLAEKNGIRIETVEEAGDHYFTGSWKHVWSRILEEMTSAMQQG